VCKLFMRKIPPPLLAMPIDPTPFAKAYLYP
jgi:hypothetical protein